MPGRSTFRGSLTVYGRPAAVGTLQAISTETPPILTLSVDGAGSLLAQPSAGTLVICGIEVYIGGRLVPLDKMLGPWSVKLTIEAGQNLQEWSFSTVLEGGIGIFGSPYESLGCAFGSQSVDIVGVYLTDTGPARYPLISGGIGDSTSRVGSMTEGYYETHQGTCALGRFDGIPVTLIVPEGSGEQRDQIIMEAFNLVGRPITFGLSGMHVVHKELQFVDAMPIAVAQDLADVESRRVVMNPRGELVNPLATARFGYQVAARFEERHLVAASSHTSIDHEAVITDVTLVSSQTIVQPAGTPDSGRHSSPPIESKIYGPLAIGNAAYVQNPDGTLAALTGGGDILQEDALKLRTVTQTESQYGVVVRQITYAELWKWRQAARYEWEGGGVLAAISGAYLDSTATPHGAEPAYGEPTARWRRDTDSEQLTFWDTDDLAGPVGHGALEPWGFLLAGNFGAGTARTGRKLGSISIKRGWYLPRLAVKQAIAGTSWEAVAPIVGRKILASGDGVGDGAETYQDLQWTVEALEGDELGRLHVQTTWTLGYVRPVGGAWWFQSTGPAAAEAETWGVVSQEVVTYAPISSGLHNQFKVTFDGAGRVIGNPESVDVAGPPPAIEQIQRPQVGADGTLTTSTNQQIKVNVVAGSLEAAGHLKKKAKTSVTYPESIDELADVGIGIIEQSAAGQHDFTTSANFQLWPGMWVHLTYRPNGIDHDMQIETMVHSGTATPPGQPPTARLTAFTCKRYPLIATGGG